MRVLVDYYVGSASRNLMNAASRFQDEIEKRDFRKNLTMTSRVCCLWCFSLGPHHGTRTYGNDLQQAFECLWT
jgi:hypothetical protein